MVGLQCEARTHEKIIVHAHQLVMLVVTLGVPLVTLTLDLGTGKLLLQHDEVILQLSQLQTTLFGTSCRSRAMLIASDTGR